jgi:hypothetical protein
LPDVVNSPVYLQARGAPSAHLFPLVGGGNTNRRLKGTPESLKFL